MVLCSGEVWRSRDGGMYGSVVRGGCGGQGSAVWGGVVGWPWGGTMPCGGVVWRGVAVRRGALQLVEEEQHPPRSRLQRRAA